MVKFHFYDNVVPIELNSLFWFSFEAPALHPIGLTDFNPFAKFKTTFLAMKKATEKIAAAFNPALVEFYFAITILFVSIIFPSTYNVYE